MADPTEITIPIHHHGTKHPFTIPASAILTDLSETISSTLNIPPSNQKLLISPKPGMLKPPFPETKLQELPLTSPKFKITLLGTPASEIANLNTQGEEVRHREQKHAAAQAEARREIARGSAPGSGGKGRGGGIHTLSSSSSSNNYTFARLEPLPYLPNPSRSRTFLARLRDDPGIRSAMEKHRFSVGLLTEMDPVLHTTSESRTLGLNRNKGEIIELRLRTDAYDGYRDYRTIRKTLCHELAHCVFSEHDRDFWDLTGKIEKEVERDDWKSGGRAVGGVGGDEFYNPGDWEAEREGGHVHDEGGLVGSSQVLGGNVGITGAGGRSASGMREAVARAAEERARREKERRDENA